MKNSFKFVWIKRFNSDGSLKPVKNWVFIEVPKNVTSIVSEMTQDWEFKEYQMTTFDFDYYTWQKHTGITAAIEWLDDQRGDGWFYFEDGHYPNLNEQVLIFDGNSYLVHLFEEEMKAIPHGFKCWSPIISPKFV